MNTPVSFPIAKLLKEKGFDSKLNKVYVIEKDYTIFNKTESDEIITFLNGDKLECYNEPINWNTVVSQTNNEYYLAPTVDDVKWWFYNKYGVWIEVKYLPKYKKWDYDYCNVNWSKEEFYKKQLKDFDNILEHIFNNTPKYNSPLDAYEAAIRYILTDFKLEDNYIFTIKDCPGYEGHIPNNLTHEVCKHCGSIKYYH